MWALVDGNNVVKNLIEYDGFSAYEPPDGLILKEVPDHVRIGMDSDIKDADIPKPPPATKDTSKPERNKFYKYNLAMVGLYTAAKKENPNLVFSDYLDSLDALKDGIIID